MKPIILIDVDGVLLIWQTFAIEYCLENGLDTKNSSFLQERDIFINPFVIDGDDDQSESLKHIKRYNESDFMDSLKHYPDSIGFVNAHKNDFDFIAVTAMSDNTECLNRRLKNLEKIYGKGVFKEVLGCGIRESKFTIFKELQNSYGSRIVAYIDDLAKNLECARRGLGDGVKLFHLVRDVRDSAKLDCSIVSCLSQINLEC